MATRRQPNEYDWANLEFDQTILRKHFTTRKRRDIKGVVIHNMLIENNDPNYPHALDTCYNVWQTRPASAHYGVDHKFVRQYVWDKDYAWANANAWANEHMYSIEHANSNAQKQLVGWGTFNNGARLTAYLHNHEGIVPKLNETIKRHCDYTATGCPGVTFLSNWEIFGALVTHYHNQIKMGIHPEYSEDHPGHILTSSSVTELPHGFSC